jgi:hypothetical protein
MRSPANGSVRSSGSESYSLTFRINAVAETAFAAV